MQNLDFFKTDMKVEERRGRGARGGRAREGKGVGFNMVKVHYIHV
jgi:hypothetical protein